MNTGSQFVVMIQLTYYTVSVSAVRLLFIMNTGSQFVVMIQLTYYTVSVSA